MITMPLICFVKKKNKRKDFDERLAWSVMHAFLWNPNSLAKDS